MFQKSNQKQTPIKHTIITKTIGTNNGGNINKYKPHVKNNTNIYIIVKKQKLTGKSKQNQQNKQRCSNNSGSGSKNKKNTWYH